MKSDQDSQRFQLPDGRALGFASYGAEDGPCVVYFHGWPASRLQGSRLAAPAAALGARVIAAERPGIGLSSPHELAPAANPFRSHAADLALLLAHLEIPHCRVLGVSGGCPYALAACLEPTMNVHRAAIVCGAPPLGDLQADAVALHLGYRILIHARLLRKSMLALGFPFVRRAVARGPRRLPLRKLLASLPAADREALEDPEIWTDFTRDFLASLANGPASVQTDGETFLRRWEFDPAEITIPVAVWHGLADKNIPLAASRALAAKLSHPTTHWRADEGHFSLPLRHCDEILADLLA